MSKKGKPLSLAILRTFDGESESELKQIIDNLGYRDRKEVNLNVLFAIERLRDRDYLKKMRAQTENQIVKSEVARRLKILPSSLRDSKRNISSYDV